MCGMCRFCVARMYGFDTSREAFCNSDRVLKVLCSVPSL